jgi:hypothetical protein
MRLERRRKLGAGGTATALAETVTHKKNGRPDGRPLKLAGDPYQRSP